MKPLRVSMQAFGCYLQECRVDFTLLGENPIFLITGPTGGGKTTILDAMCFALYCRAAGGRRSWDGMRCASAPDSLPTSVDFSFRLGKEEYRFFRSLTPHVIRGSGRRELRDEHACYRREGEDWNLICSGSESKVREEAQALLGLTCEQFSQVIVLPQGDFLKLLRANSSEKAQILQTLFATERWSRLMRLARDSADGLEKSLDELRTRRLALLAREEAENAQELAEKLLAWEKELEETESLSRGAKKALEQSRRALSEGELLDRDFSSLEQKNAELGRLSASGPEMELLQKKLGLWQKLFRTLPYQRSAEARDREFSRKREDAARADEALKGAERSLETAEKAAKAVGELRREIGELTRSLSRLEALRDAFIRYAASDSAQKQAESELVSLEHRETESAGKLSAAEENLKKGESFLRSIREASDALPACLEEVRLLEARADALTRLTSLERQLPEKQGALLTLHRREQEQNARLHSLRTALEALERLLRERAAAGLALSLHENEPCPVCGSLLHPAPAAMPERSAEGDPEELRALIRREEDGAAALLRESAEQSAAVAQLEKEKEDLLSSHPELPGENFSVLLEQVLPLREQAKKRLSELQGLALRLRQAQERMDLRQKERDAAQEEITALRDKRAGLEQKLAGLRSSAAELLQTLGEYRQPGAAQAELDRRKKRIEGLTEQADSLERSAAKARSDLSAAKAASEAEGRALGESAQSAREARESLGRERLSTGLSEIPEPGEDFPGEPLLREAEEKLRRYEEAVNSCTKERDSLSEKLSGLQRPDMVLLRNREQDAQKENDRLSRLSGSLRQRLESGKASAKQLEGLERESASLGERYSQAARLSQLLSGKNPLKVPLSLFVLGVMLDDILSSANGFFSRFSHGRYSLLRVAGTTGGNALSGLDLQVMDGQSGFARSIETLSGGEQFLASLSLAFGLSDVVQSHSGGVRLDSIFIDEGFGSLDQETLDTAMQALLQIQRSGRTVGVISHVSELKTFLSSRIEVSRRSDGSSAARVISG